MYATSSSMGLKLYENRARINNDSQLRTVYIWLNGT